MKNVVVIIGGEPAGMSCALWLKHLGLYPIIIEKSKQLDGASFNGLAPLLTMLNSCAAGVGVVNIDNGFGAAILAGQILRTAHRLHASPRDT
jgi:hypothetical protein